MNKYEQKKLGKRSLKALVAKVEIEHAVLWVRHYRTGSVSVWAEAEAGKYLSHVRPVLLKWASKVGADEGSDWYWWVDKDLDVKAATRALFRLKGAKIVELHPEKLDLFTLAYASASYWLKELAGRNKTELGPQ